MNRTFIRSSRRASLVGVLLGAALLGAPLFGQDKPLLLKAARILPLSGPELSPGCILIRDGRIQKIGAGLKAPPGAEVRDLGDRVLVPGFIDAACHVGVSRDRDEGTTALQPDLDISTSLDPMHRDFARWRAAGVTTLHLLPGDRDVLGGCGVVVKVDAEGRVTTLSEASGMKLSLRREGLEKNRAPTSALGALDMALSDEARPHLRGKRGFVAIDSPQEASLAARLSGSGMKETVLIAGPGVRRGVHRLGDWCDGVFFRALLPSSAPYALKVPAALSGAGFPVAFATEGPTRRVAAAASARPSRRRRRPRPGAMPFPMPSPTTSAPAAVRRPPSMLRLSASLAVAAGMDADQARRALSANAAELLGVADRVGTLEVGKDADVVVLDRDPLDPRARICMVIQDGRVVHERKDK